MSYCRFENTYKDLIDCYHNINEPLSESERLYRERLVDLCQEILKDYDPPVYEDEGPEYDSAGFTDEDRVVDGEYRVIIDADMEAQDEDVFGNNKI